MCWHPIELVLGAWRVIAGATERTHAHSVSVMYVTENEKQKVTKDRKAGKNSRGSMGATGISIGIGSCIVLLVLASLKRTSEWRIQNILEKKTIEMRLGW